MSPITKATKSYPSLFTKPKAHNYLYQAPHYLLITKPQLGNVNPEAGLPHYCFTKLGLGKEVSVVKLIKRKIQTHFQAPQQKSFITIRQLANR